MYRIFIAAVVSAAVLITGLNARPAQASSQDRNNDLAAVLAGIAGVAVLGAILHDRKDRDRKREESRKPRHVEKPRLYPRDAEKPRLVPRPLPPRVARKILPQQCVRSVENARGRDVRVLGARCLQKHSGRIHHMPRACYREIETRRGIRGAYGLRCLRERGYSLSRG